MDAVFALADRISVLVYGKIIVTGAPQEIRNSPEVRKAYLGDSYAPSLMRSTHSTTRTRCCSAPALEVRQGEVVALMGRNGMGKTTTVNNVVGLIRPRSGSITFEGRTLNGLPPYRIAKIGNRAGARRTADIPDADGARESGGDGGELRRARRAVDARSRLRAVSSARRSAATTWATSSPVASSRCWRSAAR